MKLNKSEKESVLAGKLEVRRPIRKSRSGRALRCTVSVADVTRIGNRYFAAKSIRRDPGTSEWVIQLEEVGEWAVQTANEQNYTAGDLEELLPEVLVWDEEPDVEVGDLVVFSWRETHIDPGTMLWAARHEGEDGLTVPEETTRREPAEFLEITHVGRHKRGHWIARFVVKGTDKLEYMARTSGTTTSPQISIDGDAPIPRLLPDPDADLRSERQRDRQRLVAAKKAQLEQLVKESRPGVMARLTVSIGDLDAKIKAIDREEMKCAA